MTKLSVNINKIALIRNSRKGNNPSLEFFSKKIIEYVLFLKVCVQKNTFSWKTNFLAGNSDGFADDTAAAAAYDGTFTSVDGSTAVNVDYADE